MTLLIYSGFRKQLFSCLYNYKGLWQLFSNKSQKSPAIILSSSFQQQKLLTETEYDRTANNGWVSVRISHGCNNLLTAGGFLYRLKQVPGV